MALFEPPLEPRVNLLVPSVSDGLPGWNNRGESTEGGNGQRVIHEWTRMNTNN